jgi:hypothetical protein
MSKRMDIGTSDPPRLWGFLIAGSSRLGRGFRFIPEAPPCAVRITLVPLLIDAVAPTASAA